MNDNQINCFLESARLMNFTKAAESLFLSQPAVSRYIAALEKELKVKLFERQNNVIMLTNEGEQLYDLFSRYKMELNSLTEKFSSKNRTVPISLGYMAGWSISRFLTDIRLQIAKKTPNVLLNIELLDLDALILAIQNGVADIILILEDSIRGNSIINYRPVYQINRVLLYSSYHPLAAKDNLTPYDFRDELFLVPGSSNTDVLNRNIRLYCDAFGFIPRLKAIKSMDTLLGLVENGMGVAFFDSLGHPLSNSNFKYISLHSKHTVVAAWNSLNHSDIIDTIVDILVDCFS